MTIRQIPIPEGWGDFEIPVSKEHKILGIKLLQDGKIYLFAEVNLDRNKNLYEPTLLKLAAYGNEDTPYFDTQYLETIPYHSPDGELILVHYYQRFYP